MGNDLFSQYSIEKTPFLTCGHLNLWKIYKAIHKERKQPACVFVFDKKHLDSFPSSTRDELLTILRKDATCLTKYKHPNILSIIEPLVEDKNNLSFITESFTHTLNTFINDDKVNTSKLELKLVMNDVCKGVSFLNDTCHMLHMNVNPDNIFITNNNTAKLSGLCFSMNVCGSGDEHGEYTLNTVHTHLNPNVSYISPSVVFNQTLSGDNDVFAVACVMYFMLNDSHRQLINVNAIDNNAKNVIGSYKTQYALIESAVNNDITDDNDKQLLLHIFNSESNNNAITISELLEHEWFTEHTLKALLFIENLPTNDITKNYAFLKQLPSMLSLFDIPVLSHRVLPVLLRSLQIESLINPILPSVFAICEHEELSSYIPFETEVFPKLKLLFKLKTIPQASLYFLLSKMTFIGKHISTDDFAKHCVPIICKALDCGVSRIQDVVIDNLDFVSNKIDSTVFSGEIYPRLMQILYHTNSTALKIKLFKSIKALYSLMDISKINETLLDDLETIRKHKHDSVSTSGVVMVYDAVVSSVTETAITEKVIPSLLSILSEQRISRALFEKCKTLINVYVDKIKDIRENELTNEDEINFDDDEYQEKPKSIQEKYLKCGMCDNESFLNNFFGKSHCTNIKKKKKKVKEINPLSKGKLIESYDNKEKEKDEFESDMFNVGEIIGKGKEDDEGDNVSIASSLTTVGSKKKKVGLWLGKFEEGDEDEREGMGMGIEKKGEGNAKKGIRKMSRSYEDLTMLGKDKEKEEDKKGKNRYKWDIDSDNDNDNEEESNKYNESIEKNINTNNHIITNNSNNNVPNVTTNKINLDDLLAD